MLPRSKGSQLWHQANHNKTILTKFIIYRIFLEQAALEHGKCMMQIGKTFQAGV